MEKQEEKQFMQVDIPDGIVTFLERRNGIHTQKFEKKYSLSELLSCIRKSYYAELNCEKKNLSRDAEIERLWSITRGDFLHEITRAYRWRELDTKFKVRLENGKNILVSGRLDMYDWKTKTIIDLKTIKFVRWQIKQGFLPKPEHIIQLQCYGTMFSSIIPVEKLCLVYADMDGLAAFQVKNKDMTQWMTKRVQELDDGNRITQEPKSRIIFNNEVDKLR